MQAHTLTAEAGCKRVCVRGPTDGQNDDRHGCEVQSSAVGQRLDRGLITPAFDEHDRAGFGLGDDALRVIKAQRRAWPRDPCEAVVQRMPAHGPVSCGSPGRAARACGSAPARRRRRPCRRSAPSSRARCLRRFRDAPGFRPAEFILNHVINAKNRNPLLDEFRMA